MRIYPPLPKDGAKPAPCFVRMPDGRLVETLPFIEWKDTPLPKDDKEVSK